MYSAVWLHQQGNAMTRGCPGLPLQHLCLLLRRTTTLTDLLGTQDVSKEVAKLEGRIFELYGHNQVNQRI
jgi:hypothetical protein